MDRIEEFVLYSIKEQVRFFNRTDIDLATMFDAFLEIDISGEDKIEVPASFSGIAISKKSKYDTLVLPITSPSTATPRKLVRGILSDFMSYNQNTRVGFAYCKTSKGDYYYGLPGIILNESKEPLLVITEEIACNIPQTAEGTFSALRVICHVSPKVFLHQDRLIEKTIIKKIIPFCSTKIIERRDAIRNPAYSEDHPHIVGTSIKVVIDDCSNFVVRPIPPKPSTTCDGQLGKLVTDYIEEVIRDDN